MFCSKCGQEVSDDASFCSKCGSPTGGLKQPSSQESGVRQTTYELLSSVDRKLRDQRAHYRAIQDDNIKLAELRKSDKDKGRWIFSVAWGLALWYLSGFIEGESAAIGCRVAACVPFAICALGAARKAAMVKNLRRDIATHVAAVVEIYASVKDNPLSFEHSSPYALDSLLAIVRQGRADTLKEALNVYEDEVHKSSMLDLQKAAVNEATAARIAAEQAREYAKRRQITYFW